jgi:GT2 family glycosyltransferase
MKNREISRPEQYKSQYFELIYAPHGSCIILHKTFLEHGGKIDYKGFMYGEEIYIGEEALKQNFKILWVPDLKVRHFKKATTGMVRHAQKVRWRLEISKIIGMTIFQEENISNI